MTTITERLREIARLMRNPDHNERSATPAELHEAAAALAAIAAELEAAPAGAHAEPSSSTDFIRRTNEDYIAWCAKTFIPESLDGRGMKSLDGLLAWQEQERRMLAALASRDAALDRLHHVLNKHGLHPGRTDDDIIEIVDKSIASRDERIAALERELSDARDQALAVNPGDEHEAGIVRDLEAMANDKDNGFWSCLLAIGALNMLKQRDSRLAGLDADLREERDRIASMRTECGAEADMLTTQERFQAGIAEALKTRVAELTAQARHAEDCLDAAKDRIKALSRHVTRLMHLASIGGARAPNDNGEYVALVSKIRSIINGPD